MVVQEPPREEVEAAGGGRPAVELGAERRRGGGGGVDGRRRRVEEEAVGAAAARVVGGGEDAREGAGVVRLVDDVLQRVGLALRARVRGAEGVEAASSPLRIFFLRFSGSAHCMAHCRR